MNAFSILSTAINNKWAWVAIITGAVALWTIRGLSSPPPRKISEVAALTPSTVEHANRHSAPAPRTTESEGSRKGKFTVYYYNDDLTLESNNGGGAAAEREGLRWRCGDDWERTVAVRMGDMGWYKCLDLNVLDGSVVRLWE